MNTMIIKKIYVYKLAQNIKTSKHPLTLERLDAPFWTQTHKGISNIFSLSPLCSVFSCTSFILPRLAQIVPNP